jgi:hypothetical protein
MRDGERPTPLCTSHTATFWPHTGGDLRKCVTAIYWGSSGRRFKSCQTRHCQPDTAGGTCHPGQRGYGFTGPPRPIATLSQIVTTGAKLMCELTRRVELHRPHFGCAARDPNVRAGAVLCGFALMFCGSRRAVVSIPRGHFTGHLVTDEQ